MTVNHVELSINFLLCRALFSWLLTTCLPMLLRLKILQHNLHRACCGLGEVCIQDENDLFLLMTCLLASPY